MPLGKIKLARFSEALIIQPMAITLLPAMESWSDGPLACRMPVRSRAISPVILNTEQKPLS